MSYCRFSDGDVYMWPTVYGGICCQRCRLAERHKSIFTTGGTIFHTDIEPCEYCNGEGCDHCMVHGDSMFYTRSDALGHLLEHQQAGHSVPQYAIERLRHELDELGETAGIEMPEEER